MPYYTLSPEILQKSLSFDPSELIEKSSEGTFDTNKRTLIIGLGGMGVRTLCEIKKNLRDRVGMPSDSMIRFLAIDSDRHDLIRALETGLLSKDELFLLYNESILPAIRDAYSTKKDDTLRALRRILPPPSAGFHPHLCASGACQTRLAGRASLMEPTLFRDLIEKLRSVILKLSDFQNQSLHIHIITGLCGGTGSGIIVDVPYILHKILLDLGVRSHAQFFGHLYLPNVDADSFKETLPLDQIENMRANGYAALKEIDYYMNIAQIGESFEIDYPNWGTFAFKKPIFTSCILHGGKHPFKINERDPRTEAVQSCVDSLLQDLVSQFYNRDRSERPSSLLGCLALQEFRDGSMMTVQRLVSENDLCFHESASYLYDTFDSASLFFPADRIKAYAISTVTEKAIAHLQAQAEAVTQEDVDDFARNLIAPEDSMRSTLDTFSDQIYDCFDSITWRRSVIADKLEFDLRLRGEMNRLLAEFDRAGKLSSDAITSAHVKADAIFKHPKKGPFFLARLLHGCDTVTGYYERIKQYTQIAQAKITEAEAFLSEAIPKLEELTMKMVTFFGFTQNRLEVYKDLAHSIYLKTFEIKLLQNLTQEYYRPVTDRIGICYRMKQSLDDNYLYFADILTRIGEIMQGTPAECRKDLYPENAASGNILGFRDVACMKPLIDSVDRMIRPIEALDESEILKFGISLAASITDNRDSWTLYDSSQADSDLKKNLRYFAYGYPLFRDVLSRDLPAYLEEAYANCDEATRQEVANFLLTHLKARSAPRFRFVEAFSPSSISNLHYEYGTIPAYISAEWEALFQTVCSDAYQNNLHRTFETNTISYHQIYFRIPLWLHADLATYEQAYYRYHRVGRHINENPNLLPPYKHYPPLIPREQYFRFTGKDGTRYENPAEDNFLHELRSLITFCLENGIIHLDEYGERYVVSLPKNIPPLDPSDDAVKAFIRNYCEAQENRDHSGNLRLGAHLYYAMLDCFGRRRCSIAPVGICNVSPDEEENLPIIIRKQMELFGKLQTAAHDLKIIQKFVTSFC